MNRNCLQAIGIVMVALTTFGCGVLVDVLVFKGTIFTAVCGTTAIAIGLGLHWLIDNPQKGKS
ncbi:MAG TPA: hypothetical protein PLD25_28075 [Chloroflexota bacterium]|nr:hypothetical protein [Chloroflexota bacterium]